jgi:FkbM family methyltransferase
MEPMVFRAIKHFLRRRSLAQHDITGQCVVPTWTAGARSGVWTVCPEGLGPNSVVYSFGVGNNIDWELALIQRFGVCVHAFDPTPASVAWVRLQALPDRFCFQPVGIAGHDGYSTFRLPPHGSRFNYHPVFTRTREPEAEDVTLPVRRLSTMMAELAHDHIDLLKMDVEGAEYGALDDMLTAGIRPRQVLVEFHHHFASIGLDETVRAIRGLNSAGYRIFHISDRGLEFGFLHTA